MMVEETQCHNYQYLISAQREDLEEKRAQKHTHLVMRGDIQDMAWWLMDREKGGF